MGEDLLEIDQMNARGAVFSWPSSIRARFQRDNRHFLRAALQSRLPEAKNSRQPIITRGFMKRWSCLGWIARSRRERLTRVFPAAKRKRTEILTEWQCLTQICGARRDRQRPRHRRAQDRSAWGKLIARADLGILLITHYQRLLNYIVPDTSM